MTEAFEYISKTRLEYRNGQRHALLGEVPEPVVYGMQGALKQYYGVKAEAPPRAAAERARAVRPAGCRAHESVKDAIAITWDASLRVGDQVIALRSDAMPAVGGDR